MLDSKCDYPAACNAVETVLVHSSLMHSMAFETIASSLKDRGVVLHSGPQLTSMLPVQSAVSSMRVEYGGLECSVEVVDSLEEAIKHINSHGSSHTDCIVTENGKQIYQGINGHDSCMRACSLSTFVSCLQVRSS